MEDEANIEITARLQTEQQKQDHDKTALLIGTPNSGKTTILKQFYFTQKSQGGTNNGMECLSERELFDLFSERCLEEIRSNCIHTINILAHYLRTKVSKRRRCSCTDHHYVQFTPRPHLDELKKAWNSVRKLYTKKSIAPSSNRYHNKPKRGSHSSKRSRSRWLRLKENMNYFLDRIEEIMDDKYQLTPRDLIMHKTESLAMSRHHGRIEGFNGLHLIDFGDSSPLQINPCSGTVSAKSLKLFQEVDGIIFVAALSDYCVFDPNLNANRLSYSLQIFEALIKLKWFTRTKIFLVMSKYDILKQRLKSGISLTEYFGDKWDSTNDYKNRKMPLTLRHMTRSLEVEIPMDIERMMIRYLVNSDHDDSRLMHCTNTAAEFIKMQFVAIYNKYRDLDPALHHEELNVDFYRNVCTDEEVMRATLWGIRCSMYDKV